MLTFFTHVDPWTPPFARAQASIIPSPCLQCRRGDRWVWAAAWTMWTKMSTTGSPNRFESGDANPGNRWETRNPYGFLWRFPREAWGKNPGFFPIVHWFIPMSSLKNCWKWDSRGHWYDRFRSDFCCRADSSRDGPLVPMHSTLFRRRATA